MRQVISLIAFSGLGAFALVLSSCENDKKSPAAASATAAPAPTPPPAPTPTLPPEEKKPGRPEKIATEVTPERRQKVESAIPEAKGFVLATGIEAELKKKKLDKEPPALTLFDGKARGKWVLFVGPISNNTPSGFDLPVTYTQAEGDMLGMSRKWFMVTFSGVKGYEPSKFKGGETVVVLGKYDGKKKASAAYELVDLGYWQ
jgi:hypothetical protein